MNEDLASVMAFDALYTNNQIQKLKVLLPYIDPSMQKNMAVYIKYMELKYTMELFKKHPFHIISISSMELWEGLSVSAPLISGNISFIALMV